MVSVRMWEAVAAPGRLPDLVSWVLAAAPPAAAVYRSADDRVVVIDPAGADPGPPPADLVAGDPHAWDFEPVRRTLPPPW
ncbi:MAG TPA: hypothetical protein VEL73_09395 [Mycobacteriales bacterium]|nr:hypothetical protein [Mycobacteriales bacterium]